MGSSRGYVVKVNDSVNMEYTIIKFGGQYGKLLINKILSDYSREVNDRSYMLDSLNIKDYLEGLGVEFEVIDVDTTFFI